MIQVTDKKTLFPLFLFIDPNYMGRESAKMYNRRKKH